MLGTATVVLKQLITSNYSKMSFIEVVPMINNFLSALGGFFLIKTKRAYKTRLENLGPICTNSKSLSTSSRTISDKGDLYASSNTLLIA